MTDVQGREGYFEDPVPILRTPSQVQQQQAFSGTTRAVMVCGLPLTAAGCSWARLRISAGGLEDAIAAAEARVTNMQNLNIFQDDAGGWHAVLAIGVNSAREPEHWTVLVHAHPATDATPDTVPLAWTADTVLSGSFSHRVDGNYDGKFYEEDGRLYLLYVRNAVPEPGLRNEIVLQPMISPTQVAPDPPAILLSPGEHKQAVKSEWYADTKAKLVEAPYLVRINGKHALLYSTGGYLTDTYKVGVAWSDALVPARGARYRRVLEPGKKSFWGRHGRPEVHYLLQSEDAKWPNFTGDRVIGPGVAAVVQGPDGGSWLTFAGFQPDDMPLLPSGMVNGSHRRPFYVPLRINVPADASVQSASDAELGAWLEPEER